MPRSKSSCWLDNQGEWQRRGRESRARKGNKEGEEREKESEGAVVEHEVWGIGEDEILRILQC